MAAVRTTGSDERGQVQSSLVAVAAVAAVIAGLLLLFGTGGTDGRTAAQETKPTPTVVPATTQTPTAAPSTPAETPTQPATTSPATTRPASTQPTTRPVTTSTRPVVTGPRPRIEIYNNTTRHGLADEVANRARALGWTVAGIDNWRGKVAGSTVYYPPGMMDHAAALAGDLEVGRIKAALDNMKTDRLTVILTSDYTG